MSEFVRYNRLGEVGIHTVIEDEIADITSMYCTYITSHQNIE
jgi:hypothetical protein